MPAFLKLIRLPNLLIIAFTMYMVRYCLVLPIVRQAGLELMMPDLFFFLITLSTVMVAAAGYVINDYFDMKIDTINKPDEVVVDKGVKRRVAMGAHALITTLGVFIGAGISYLSGLFMVGTMIFVFSTASLWFYSTTFKRQFLTGNLLIAVLSALIPLVAALYEMSFVTRQARLELPFEVISTMNEGILTVLSGYAFFAFATSLLRELIKDTEDHEGDEVFGCKTLPVVWGVRTAKYVSAFICLSILALISYLSFSYVIFLGSEGATGLSMVPFYYVLFAVQLPLLALFVMLLLAHDKKHFRWASFVTKFIMLTGISFLFIFRHQLESGNWVIV
ncbi:MAG: geranylgeranylglycerol-phosphate geranylgeranyltransferase [Bacteroidota bacterium]